MVRQDTRNGPEIGIGQLLTRKGRDTSKRISAGDWCVTSSGSRFSISSEERPMQKFRFGFLLAMVLTAATVSHAQSSVMDLPRQSQHAVVMQRIGLTDITINYHRPLVGGRAVWGKLVPYGEVWRSWANENTTITFSDAVSIESKPLERG